jgi:hypothetical protein
MTHLITFIVPTTRPCRLPLVWLWLELTSVLLLCAVVMGFRWFLVLGWVLFCCGGRWWWLMYLRMGMCLSFPVPSLVKPYERARYLLERVVLRGRCRPRLPQLNHAMRIRALIRAGVWQLPTHLDTASSGDIPPGIAIVLPALPKSSALLAVLWSNLNGCAPCFASGIGLMPYFGCPLPV